MLQPYGVALDSFGDPRSDCGSRGRLASVRR